MAENWEKMWQKSERKKCLSQKFEDEEVGECSLQIIFENPSIVFSRGECNFWRIFLNQKTCFLKIWHVFHKCTRFGPKIWRKKNILRYYLDYSKCEKKYIKIGTVFPKSLVRRLFFFCIFPVISVNLNIQGKMLFITKLFLSFHYFISINETRLKSIVFSLGRLFYPPNLILNPFIRGSPYKIFVYIYSGWGLR